MFSRLVALAEQRAAVVIAGWLVLVVSVFVLAPGITPPGETAAAEFLPHGSSSRQAEALLQRAFPGEPGLDAAVVVAVRPAGLTGSDHAFLDGLGVSLASQASAGAVRTVWSAATRPELAPVLRSPDGRAEILVVALRDAPSGSRTSDAVAFLRHRLAAAPAGLAGHVSGLAGLNADRSAALRATLPWPAMAALLLLFGTLLVLLRRCVRSALVSVLTVASALLVTRGAMVILAPTRAGAANLAGIFMGVVVLTVATDHAGYFLTQVRRDRSSGKPAVAPLGLPPGTAAPALAATAVLVAAALVAFGRARLGVYRWIGFDLGLALAVTLAASLTLTPALTHALAVRPRTSDRRGWRGPPRLADRLSRRVRHHPRTVFAGVLLTVALASAALGAFSPTIDPASGLPGASDARQGFDALDRHYPPGTMSPGYLVVSADRPITEDGALSALDRLTDELRRDPRLAEVRSLTQPAGAPLTLDELPRLLGGSADPRALGIDPDRVDITPLYERLTRPGGLRFDAAVLSAYPQLRDHLGFFLSRDELTTRLVVTPRGGPDDRDTRAAFRDVERRTIAVLAGSSLSGARVAMGGPGMVSIDVDAAGRGDARRLALLLSLGVLAALALLTRSLRASLWLAGSTTACFTAATGVTVVVFQGLLGEPGLPFWLPVLVVVVAAVLVVDSAMFMSWSLAARRRSGERAAPVRTPPPFGLHRLLLAGAFAVLALAPVPALRPAGFALSLGVILEACVGRRLVAPSILAVLDRDARPMPDRRARWLPRPALAGGASGSVFLAVALVIALLDSGSSLAVVPGGASAPAASTPPGSIVASPGPFPDSPGPASVTVTTQRLAGEAESRRAEVATPAVPESLHVSAEGVEAAVPDGDQVSAEPVPPSVRTGVPSPRVTQPPVLASTEDDAADRPGKVIAPANGTWRYHVQGTWSAGLAGSPQSFAQDVTTQVSRRGGTDDAPELELVSAFEAGRYQEVRRYRPGALELVSARFSSAWLSFGGTFSPSLPLLPWAATTGSRWRVDWTTEEGWGQSEFRMAGPRRVTVGQRSFTCYLVEGDSSFHGGTEGRERMKACWVPELGMSADDEHEFEGTYQGVHLSGRWHSTLLSATAGP